MFSQQKLVEFNRADAYLLFFFTTTIWLQNGVGFVSFLVIPFFSTSRLLFSMSSDSTVDTRISRVTVPRMVFFLVLGQHQHQ